MGTRGFIASGSTPGLGTMEVAEIGSGPAIVCLHDEGHAAASWRGLASELRARYRVLMPELPPGTSVETGAGLLMAALADRGIARPHALVGIGAGAYRALHLATWRELPMEVLALVEPTLTAPALTAYGPVPAVRALLSRVGAHVYLRCGERGARAACDLLVAATGGHVDVVRGAGALVAPDPDTRAALVAAVDALDPADTPPPRVSVRHATA